MQDGGATIFVIDDDASMRNGLDSLLRSVGFDVKCMSSAHEFSFDTRPDLPACMVLDVRMPSLSGIDFQAALVRRGVSIPIVFLTGHGDVPMCAQAMKAGAVDFLLKPFREQDLLDAIGVALEKDRKTRRDEAALHALRTRFNTLTRRERQVMSLVVTGLLNKQVAAELGLSEIAIKVNRGQAMRKMAAISFADLVRMADKLGLPLAQDAVRGSEPAVPEGSERHPGA